MSLSHPETCIVPPASGGPICDRTLDLVARHMEQASNGTPISDDAIDLVQICVAPLLRELQGHRARAAAGFDMPATGNVVHLPRGNR
ncbi:hypothetical protein [Oceaniglobus trochenteri]|uniref:hypothetical protein n=1 Tax=Oceaniglobus trochenteri TaxID=2763260 RepID=UPI001CFFCEA9|nr:hypothetical protein [Oceaniglobus trochenteri]